MADTSYLFGGSAPSTTTAALTDTSSTLPAWLQEYTRGLAGQATAVAGGQYQGYTPPTGAATYGEQAGKLAGFDPMQTQSFQNIQSQQGNWKPYTDYASQTVPQAVGSYMNPYESNVMDVMAQRGQRNLTENLLPQVNSTFAGAGQFGSTRNADFTNRALRDTNQNIMDQQAQLAQTGFQNAQTTAMSDMQRQAALGQQVQQLGFQDASMLGTAGQQKQQQTQQNLNMGYEDWNKQKDWQKSNLDWLSQIVRGLPADQTRYQYQTEQPQQQISPLAMAAQGFLGARSLFSPQTTTKPAGT